MKNGIEIVKQFEGFSEVAYICPAGKITIGYGNTFYEDGTPVKMGEMITKERAEALLSYVYGSFQRQVKALVKVTINQNQLDALTSFAYNLGIANLKNSTLLRLINQSKFNEAATQFDKWVYSNKKILPGLVKRRAAEKELFLTPIGQQVTEQNVEDNTLVKLLKGLFGTKQ